MSGFIAFLDFDCLRNVGIAKHEIHQPLLFFIERLERLVLALLLEGCIGEFMARALR